jgi:hypothetical protein
MTHNVLVRAVPSDVALAEPVRPVDVGLESDVLKGDVDFDEGVICGLTVIKLL